MGEKLLLKFKGLTGFTETIEISKNATILDAKRLLHTKRADFPPHRQKLFIDFRGGSGTPLKDEKTLSSYPTIKSGSTIVIVIDLPWKLYVQDPHGKIYDIEIPSSEPLSYSITDLKALAEQHMKQSLVDYQFQFKEKPVEECLHGKRRTLKDCGINKEDTVFIMKIGIVVNITAPQIDICFMMDCTGSMRSWIESVKANVKNVRDGLEQHYKGCDIRFSFVRYTDYDQPSSTRTTWVDFTQSLSQFHTFVDPIKASGGKDTPEDIMGALKVTLSNLSWRPSATKVLMHIADAPCHGTQYHSGDDDYPNGDPAGITHESMMAKVVHHDIQYWFAYINRSNTDKMIDIFNESLKSQSSQRLIIRQVDATKPDELTSAVHKSVTASVFANEARKKIGGTLDPTEPNWASLLPQYGQKTPPVGPKSLYNLQEGFKPEGPSVSLSVKIAATPFAEGSESLVYRGYDTKNSRQVVLKKPKEDRPSLDSLMKVLETQTIAATYASEFNTHKQRPAHLETLEFLPCTVV
ncbi:PREDICTED: alpha-protein kinase vwkA-like [Amphimedon queenslandica]|uniref:Ubiquitin-like domain-containing protein n=1 Tax=Amphimedon queenslandica TaxID=400682 RepID=A0AAN0J875_AMPQE|nr:PREDICTED: alpha-protein kinase vwkA-like [Amphimedon queenslandica]|eukprot:XP_019852957.1 PREDICTED: alpha-protein kinase vwkA-like [Amphimedon queenslandica]